MGGLEMRKIMWALGNSFGLGSDAGMDTVKMLPWFLSTQAMPKQR